MQNVYHSRDNLHALEPIDRGVRFSFSTRHLTYSLRWRFAALVGIGMAGLAWRKWPWRQAVAAFLGAAAAGGLTLASAKRSIYRLTMEYITLPLEQLTHPLRIAQLSDFHFGSPHSKAILQQALAAVKAAKPDLIVLTGDFLDQSDDLESLRTALTGHLQAPLGVFACLGNHDYWSNPRGIALMLEDLGITVLGNEHRQLEWYGQPIVVAGVTDPWYGDPELARALEGKPADAPIILLAHCPDYITTAAAAGVALQLSGHTHAGHFDLPGLGPLVLPKLGVDYYRGLYRVDATWLYVSRGMGGIAWRLGADPEVTMIEITPTQQESKHSPVQQSPATRQSAGVTATSR